MPNSITARKNMVDCQIHTAGVVAPAVLAAFQAVPREIFAPGNVRPVAYADEDLPLGQGRFLMAPAILARMIQASDIVPADTILDIGGATGYAAAILSSLAGTVIALDERADFIEQARRHWNSLGIRNAEGLAGSPAGGDAGRAPFDLIFINGAVAEIPARLVEQLTPEGRMIVVLKKPGAVIGQATLVKKSGERGFSSYALFDAASPYSPGFEPKPSFQF